MNFLISNNTWTKIFPQLNDNSIREGTREYYSNSRINDIFLFQESYRNNLIKTLEENKDFSSFGFSSNFLVHRKQDVRVEKITIFCFPPIASQECSSYIQGQHNLIAYNSFRVRKQYLPKIISIQSIP